MTDEELECYFYPDLVANYKPEYMSDMSFVDRSNLWKQRRETKLNKQRECKTSQETDGCTFQPKIVICF